MKDTATNIELIKRIYDELEKSHKVTVDKINEIEVSELNLLFYR